MKRSMMYKISLCCHYSHHQVTSSLIYFGLVGSHRSRFVRIYAFRECLRTGACVWEDCKCHVACTHRRLYSHRCNPWWSSNPIDHNIVEPGRASERVRIKLMSWFKANGVTHVWWKAKTLRHGCPPYFGSNFFLARFTNILLPSNSLAPTFRFE